VGCFTLLPGTDSSDRERAVARIGFIGLGRMGLPMARNLAAAGHAVKAYDISAAYHAAATQAGITPCNRLDDAVTDAEFAITMLPKLPPGALVIDSSTINISEARALHEAGRERASPCWTPRCRAASWVPRPAL
jgi:3-hydroxyisobutyrate dehydrogenase